MKILNTERAEKALAATVSSPAQKQERCMPYKVGDWVEIRCKEEILATLEPDGRLEGMPFMPQMFQYCGHRFKVYKRAHKTCDTIQGSGGRRLAGTVHLELRCDGKAHGGCQAACLIFWKEAWLKPVDETHTSSSATPGSSFGGRAARDGSCSEEDVWAATRATNGSDADDIVYSCQATELLNFTRPLSRWDMRQYVEDYTSGNVELRRFIACASYALFYRFAGSKRTILGPPLRWLYDRFQALRGGVPFPRRTGTLLAGQPAPVSDLKLQPGDLVRVKAYREILATLTSANQNRGLYFDAELVPYCGREYRIRARLTRFVDEKTGKISRLKTPAVILEDVWCQSCYSPGRAFCPRSIYSWWREAWVDKVPAEPAAARRPADAA
jgi:hypothetical protein